MSRLTKIFRNAAAVLTAGAAILTFSGCNAEEEEPELPEGSYKTVAITDGEGNPVTDENGEPTFEKVPLQTRAVTDEAGKEVTDVNGNVIYEYTDEEEEPIVWKVGFIYGGEAADGATLTMFEIARGQIQKALGLDTCYMENVLVSDFPEAVNTLLDDGCNIIVSCSPKFASSVDKESRATSTDTYFINFGGSGANAHMSSFGGELYQTAAVAGMAAAHNTTSNVIGIVADPGEYNVYGVIDAFTIGASEIWDVHTDVRVNWAWSNSESEIEAAVDDLITQGCDVIMSYMESDYPEIYCANKPVKVIGNSYTLPEIAPDNFVTGFHFNFSTFLVDEVRSIIFDNFSSKVYQGDIASGMIRLLSFGPNVTEGTQDICDKYYEYIKSGHAKVFSGELKNMDGKVMIEKGQSIQFNNIIKVNWYVQGIHKVTSFTEVTENPVSSTFDIKR